MAPFGRILSCRVKYDTSGACKGYGFVQFETAESADKALAEGKNLELQGMKIELMICKVRGNRNNAPESMNNLFVRGIPRKFTNDEFYNLFHKYGEIMNANVIKEHQSDEYNKGFGFVCYQRTEDVQKAMDALNNLEIDGSKLLISLAISGGKKKMQDERVKLDKDCNLYIKNLPEDTTEEKLKQAFDEFGPVISSRVMMEKYYDPITNQSHARPLGYGFVCFASPESATKAMAGARIKPILGQQLYASIAERREDRMAKYEEMSPFGGYYPPQAQPPYFQMNPNYGMPQQSYQPRNRRPRYVLSISYNRDIGRKAKAKRKCTIKTKTNPSKYL
jgi:polyadenylate-binding protein